MTWILLLAISSTPIDADMTVEYAPRLRIVEIQPSRFYQDTDGWFKERYQDFIPSGDPSWDIRLAASDWQLLAATDELRFRILPPGEIDGFEFGLSDIGLKETGAGWEVFSSFGWELPYPNPDIEGNVYSQTIHAPTTTARYTVIGGAEGLKTNLYFDTAAVALIPSPTTIFGSTVLLDNVYVSFILDVYDWSDCLSYIGDTQIVEDSICPGDRIEFYADDERIFSFLPSYAYRNPQDVDVLADSFTFYDDAQPIRYVVDRLNDRIYIDAPYSLFYGAESVLIDPPTIIETGQSGDSGERYVSCRSDDSDSHRTTDDFGYGYINGTERWFWIFKFDLSSISLSGCETIESASITFTRKASGGTPNVKIASLDTSTSWDANTTTSENPASTGNGYPTYSHYNYNDVAWTWQTNPHRPPESYIKHEWAVSNVANPSVGSSDSDFADDVEDMIRSNSANGFVIWPEKNDADGLNYLYLYNHRRTTASERPLLSIRITEADPGHLPKLPGSTFVKLDSGSLICGILIPATSSYYTADVCVNDVTVDLHLANHQHWRVGKGTGADADWNLVSEHDTASGATQMVFAASPSFQTTSYAALYYKNPDTGYSEESTYMVKPAIAAGGDSTWSDVEKNSLIGSVDELGDQIVNATEAIFNRIDDATSLVTSDLNQLANSNVLVSRTDGTGSMLMSLPDSTFHQNGTQISIVFHDTIPNTTPDFRGLLRNGANGAVAWVSLTSASHAIEPASFTIQRATAILPDAGENPSYEFRLNYPITEADMVPGATGAFKFWYSANTPYGVKTDEVYFSVYPKQFDASEVNTLNDQLAGLSQQYSGVNAALDILVPDGEIWLFANQAIDGCTDGNPRIGHFDVPANFPVARVICNVTEATGEKTPVWTEFFHWTDVGDYSVKSPAAGCQYGPTEIVNGQVVQATYGIITKYLGLDPDIVLSGEELIP